MNLHPRSLKRLTGELLSPHAGKLRLRAAATELYHLCASVTGIDGNSNHPDDLDETRLASGHAISTKDAARCVLDYGRTSKFLRGAHAAILEAQKKFPRTTIEILYAGCGPYATLALPLSSRFASHEIQFTLLDIHRQSLDAAQRLFQSLGLAAFVRDYIECDAASYHHHAPQAPHIILTEAMQAALLKEPQVALTINLARQLCPGGIFIPERIAIDACLCDLEKEFAIAAQAHDTNSLRESAATDKDRIHLGRVLELTPESCRRLSTARNSSEALLPKVVLDVPKESDGELRLALLTSITIFDTITLSGYESGLTNPVVLCDLGKIRGGTRLEFAYALGDKPGFKYRVV